MHEPMIHILGMGFARLDRRYRFRRLWLHHSQRNV